MFTPYSRNWQYEIFALQLLPGHRPFASAAALIRFALIGEAGKPKAV
jgi:hypothetical protein